MVETASNTSPIFADFAIFRIKHHLQTSGHFDRHQFDRVQAGSVSNPRFVSDSGKGEGHKFKDKKTYIFSSEY